MSALIDAGIERVFQWRDHLEGAPRLRDLSLEQQRKLIAVYLAEHPRELCELLAYVSEGDSSIVASLIMGNADGDMRREFDDSLFNAGLAALSHPINERIEELYDDYVTEYGVFDPADLSGPSELIGFRDDDC